MAKSSDIDHVLDIDSSVKVAPKKKLKRPKLFKVILLNDDYTTMDFVVEVLVSIFNKSQAEATQIMLEVHKKGKGVCGVYTYDIAVTKANRVAHYASLSEFPLKCDIEEV